MNEFYWYWLCNINGIGNIKIRILLDSFQSPECIYKASESLLGHVKGITGKDVSHIMESKKKTSMYEDYINLDKKGLKFVSYDSAEYPDNLRNIYDHPYALYYKGELPSSAIPSIAIVGSRNCSPYGKKMAYELGRSFAVMGTQVISGMAVGIDSAGHQGCLDIGGFTCAVLGCGADICYPRSNIELYSQIMDSGCILSEYPPGTQPLAGLFPLRNRIISGLSDLVIVVEARKKSGSLITVDQALEQNKDIMVVPGRITDKLSEGCNNLIKMGAPVITVAEDVLENFSISEKISVAKVRKNLAKTAENNSHYQTVLSNNQKNSLATEKKLLYSCLNLYPKSLEIIIEETGLNITIVSQILLELQMDGLIEEVSKNCYIRAYI